MLDKIVRKINDIIVGRTKFFLLYIKTAIQIETTNNLIINEESCKALAGKIIILAINAAKIEYAT